MLDRRHRLTTSAGFTTATRRGRRAGTRTLVLHLHVPGPTEAPAVPGTVSRAHACPRVGFVVGKAVGRAVRRNLVKRRLRDLARVRLQVLPAEAVLVVRALPAAADATYAGLAADFDRALQRLGRASVSAAAEADTRHSERSGAVHGR